MLPAKYRLQRSDRINHVLKEGQTYFSTNFIVNTLPSERNYPRIAFIASKKIGGSVERHRAVRILREATRSLLPEFSGGFDIVIVAKPSVLTCTSQDLEVELRDVVHQQLLQ